MSRIKLNVSATVEELFRESLISRKAKGLADKTLTSYQSQFQAIARHLDVSMDITALQKEDLDTMIVSMRDTELSPNSINSYTRVLKSFLSWCNMEGHTKLNIPLYKGEETIKETYTDAELAVLLKKPDVKKSTFAEYRNWVIINFLLNCGSRAATVRAVQIRDVDLETGVVYYRHTKNRKTQVIPLCTPMIAILREYLRFRGGEDTRLPLLYGNRHTAYRKRFTAVYCSIQRATRIAKDEPTPVPAYLCPQVFDRLRWRCFHAAKAVGTFYARYDKTLLQHL